MEVEVWYSTTVFNTSEPIRVQCVQSREGLSQAAELEGLYAERFLEIGRGRLEMMWTTRARELTGGAEPHM